MLTLSAAWVIADVALSTALSAVDETFETAFSVAVEAVETASDASTASVGCRMGIGDSAAFEGTEEYGLLAIDRREIREVVVPLEALALATRPILVETEI